MKRYLLFAFYEHYPAGGFNDFRGDFDTVEEVHAAFVASSCDDLHIVDSQEWLVSSQLGKWTPVQPYWYENA